MPQTPSRLADRYRLTETLGRGGMGEVWRAYDERLNRYCAIKVLRRTDDAATTERFSREARTLAALRHPGVVTVYDYGVDDGRPYLVMELLPGPSLAEMLRESGPLPIEAVRRFGIQAASALQAVHDAKVVHRDIKPANLVLDTTGAVRLVDFGIALGSTFDSTLTEFGAIIGSAAYLAPELATAGRASARSDLYGFGCLLMTLLTGRPPFADDAPVETLGRHLSEAPERPSLRRPEVPADLDSLVLDLLSKQPEERPANAAEVARRLTGGRGARPGPGPVPMPVRTFGGIAPAVGNGHPERSGTTAALPPPPPPTSHAAPRGSSSADRRVVLIGAAILGALALGGVGWLLTRSSGHSDSTPPVAVPTHSAAPTPADAVLRPPAGPVFAPPTAQSTETPPPLPPPPLPLSPSPTPPPTSAAPRTLFGSTGIVTLPRPARPQGQPPTSSPQTPPPAPLPQTQPPTPEAPSAQAPAAPQPASGAPTPS